MPKKKIKLRPRVNDTPKKLANKKAVHYVDNAAFLSTLVEYQKLCKKNIKAKVDPPPIPDLIANSICDIAVRLASKYNFAHITFKDEMISDGIERSIRAIQGCKFDPKVSSNPFAYYTQIIFWAFLRRIKIEEKQKYIKYKKMIETANELLDTDVNIVLPDDIHDFMNRYQKSQQKVTKVLSKTKNKIMKNFY